MKNVRLTFLGFRSSCSPLWQGHRDSPATVNRPRNYPSRFSRGQPFSSRREKSRSVERGTSRRKRVKERREDLTELEDVVEVDVESNSQLTMGNEREAVSPLDVLRGER